MKNKLFLEDGLFLSKHEEQYMRKRAKKTYQEFLADEDVYDAESYLAGFVQGWIELKIMNMAASHIEPEEEQHD